MSKIQIGDWQEERTPWGGVRRFRKIGNCIEYEPTIIIDGIEIPQSELEDYHERRRAARKAEREAGAKKAVAPPRLCPFCGGMNASCTKDKCAFYVNGCVFARFTAEKETEGLQCPFNAHNNKCQTDCALYRNGCTLTGIKI